MSNKLLFRLAVLVAAMMSALGAAAAEAYACYTSSNTTLTFYYDNYRSSRTGSTYDLNTGSASPLWYFSPIKTTVTKVVFDSSFANFRPTTTYSWFYDMENLQSISNISYLNTSEVTNMRFMFCNCKRLQSLDLSHFNTIKVTDMGCMFWECSSLTSLDVSYFITNNVTKMDGMFLRCTGLSRLDLSYFNTAKVINMSEMFYVCSSLQAIYVGDGWTTLPVITSNDMFFNCYKLVGGQGTTYNESNPTDKSYARIDGGSSYPGYFRAPNAPDPPIAYACYTPGNATLKFYYDNQRSSRSGVTYDLNTGTEYPGWYSDGTYADVSWVVFDPSFANARPTSICYWFSHMQNLETITGLSYLNTSKVTAMISVFYDCSNLTSLDLSNFNTSKVTVMTAMFENCSSLTSLDLNHFNTSNVTIMNAMFKKCTGLTGLDLSCFNTSKVTNMSELFARCTNLRTIYVGTGWSTAAVTSSNNMFQYCSKLVGGQGTAYDSSNPKDKTYARIDGGPSNPGYLTDTNAPRGYACYTPSNTTLTFYYDDRRHSRPGQTYLLDTGASIPGWKADGSNANVTRVVFDPSFANARPMMTNSWFDGMGNLAEIKDLGNLNTSFVTNMDFMFYMCENLINLDLSSFNTSNVTSMNSMFKYCTGMKILYLNSFNTYNVTDMTSMFEGARSLRTIYVDIGWLTRNVTASGNMFYNCTNLVGGQGTRYSGGNPKDMTYAHIDGGASDPGYLTDIYAVESYAEYSDGTLTFYHDALKGMRPGNTYFLNAPGESPTWSSYCNAVNTVVFDPSFAVVRPTTLSSWFDSMSNLTSITGMEYLNTSQVTDMHSLFNGCSRLPGVDLSNFDTRNVTDMNSMFRDCAAFQSLALSSFDTRNVTDMNAMFRGCTGLTELDLSSFNTTNVTRMIWMFYKCTNLATITVGDGWNTSNVTSSAAMFGDCTSLVGGQGTTYNDANLKDKTYAHIDGGPSNPGYFTAKNAGLRGDVNGDGYVNITDVTMLISAVMSENFVNIIIANANLNEDSEINITDVTMLINLVMAG